MTMIEEVDKKLPFLEKLFCFFVVWGSGTEYDLRSSYMNYAMAITFILIVASGRFQLKRSMLKPILGVLLLASISIFLNFYYMDGDGLSSIISNFSLILFSILFAMNKPERNKKRIEIIVKVFLFFSFLSTFLYVLYYIGVLPVVSVSETAHVSTFYNLLNVVPSDLLSSVTRNGGIYWEPGMYQVFLNFVLVYYLYNTNLRHRKQIIVYLLIIIVTTISVSGYALAVAIIGLYGINNKNSNKFMRVFSRVLIGVALIALLPTMTGLISDKQETSSYQARNLDLVLAWDVFLEHPIFGHGMINDAYENAYLRTVGKPRPCSNGMMNILMGMGIVGACFYCFWFAKALKFFSNEYSRGTLISLLLWLLISINTEPIHYQSFLCCLFGFGLAYCSTSTKKNKLSTT